MEEPVDIYRGVRFSDNLSVRIDSVEDAKEHFTVGEKYQPTFSESATVLPRVAYGFSNGLIMRVKAKTLPSPVSVGAWGASEMEVLLNHNHAYQVNSIQEENWGEGYGGRNRKVIVVDLEEITD